MASCISKGKDHSRDELKELIEAHGGKNLAAVSANVDFLVAGEKIALGWGISMYLLLYLSGV